MTTQWPDDLAGFARARDAYLELMRRVPPEAAGYLKPGDDYSVGGIAVHVNYVLEHYLAVLDALAEPAASPVRPDEPAGLEERARERARGSLTAAELEAELKTTVVLHDRVLAALGRLADPESKVPVIYGGAAEPYPTSPSDVIGWLDGHYREHVPQVEDLIAEWSSAKRAAS